MENVLILIFLFELFFAVILVINCAMDALLPIGKYKIWLQNKNWFGKIYTTITIIFTIPAAIIVYFIDPSFDDIYIKCYGGAQIYHYGFSTLVAYMVLLLMMKQQV